MVVKDLLYRLNREQLEAVSLQWGPALVVAGAGSGKTTVLTRRVAYLMSQLAQDAYSILAVTFTNRAAGEMKNRIEDIVGTDLARRLAVGTFHSLCARILRQEIASYQAPEGFRWNGNFVIYDETDSLNVLKGQIRGLNLDEKVFVPKDLRYQISSLKNDGHSCGDYAAIARTYRENHIAEIYLAYQKELSKNNALDFDDLILVFTALLKQNPDALERQRYRFRHILVDEFQDTNKAQYDLIRLLAGFGNASSHVVSDPGHWQERSLMVVGDIDQSIYSWRKADFRIILNFQNDFADCRLIKLEENYRSTSTILEVANSIIANNTERIEKVLRCNRGKGTKAQCYEGSDEIDEAFYAVEELKRLKARGRRFDDCVILYRTNAQSRAIEEFLVRSHVPYTVIGATRFYDRQEIKDVLAYLKLIYNGRDGQAFSRVINVPRRGLGKTTLERLAQFAGERSISLLEAATGAEQIKELSQKAIKGLQDFANLAYRWQMLSKAMSVSQLLELVLKETKYIEKLEEDVSSARDELALGRIENVRELVAVAKEFEAIADEPDLDSFLTRISLVSDLDEARSAGEDVVTLMTLHSAKGLEFPVVFLMGLEDGLLPHIRSLDSPTALEEERRLMYVGVTRAQDLLYLTMARQRMLLKRTASGSSAFSTTYTIPSRFLKEITPGLLSGYYPRPQVDSEMDERHGFAVPSSGVNTFAGSRYTKSTYRENRKEEPISRSRFQSGAGTISDGSDQIEPFSKISADNSFERFSVGDAVQHVKFGTGTIVQVIGENDKELYNVEFESAGKRLLDPRFAKLIKL